MEYKWAEGYVPPRGVTANACAQAVLDLPEPSPENLLAASKARRHLLHDHLWSENDAVWAGRARLEECRHILGGYRQVVVTKDREIEIRAVEFIRGSGGGKWATVEDICADPQMRDAYLNEAIRQQEQALAKTERVRQILKETESPPPRRGRRRSEDRPDDRPRP